VRDPREHHSPCGCVHRCDDVEELGVTNRASALERLTRLSMEGNAAGVAFALGLQGSLVRAFGEGCLSEAEMKVARDFCCCDGVVERKDVIILIVMII
jgi:hypothetical protein